VQPQVLGLPKAVQTNGSGRAVSLSRTAIRNQSVHALCLSWTRDCPVLIILDKGGISNILQMRSMAIYLEKQGKPMLEAKQVRAPRRCDPVAAAARLFHHQDAWGRNEGGQRANPRLAPAETNLLRLARERKRCVRVRRHRAPDGYARRHLQGAAKFFRPANWQTGGWISGTTRDRLPEAPAKVCALATVTDHG